MNILDIINKKRLKLNLNEKEIAYIINEYTNGLIPDYQMGSLLMAICINGLNDEETILWTKYMLNSGEIINYTGVKGKIVDKHSTGGVGDKTTLIIGPIVASCGVNVSKMSGRSLGWTGGTIDKLESIPGIKLKMTNKQLINQIKKIHIVIVSQTKNLVLADKKIYALRDATGTVESIGLIASSIMSKKLACNADSIIIDIKVGKGALIKNIIDARKLASVMINIGKCNKKEVICLLTNMDIPLGNNIGNSLEIEEAIDVLKNNKHNNLRELCIELSTYMVSSGLNISLIDAKKMVLEKLENLDAYKKFVQLISYQKGDIIFLPKARYKYEVQSKINGFLTNINSLELSKYSMNLGAGRKTKDDIIDYSVGIVINKNINEYVNTNDILYTIYSNKKLDDYESLINYFEISSGSKKYDLIYEIIK